MTKQERDDHNHKIEVTRREILELKSILRHDLKSLERKIEITRQHIEAG